jgi:agmatine deiminase
VILPAETDPHERTLMAWPTEIRRDALWHDELERARDVHATVAFTVAQYEPVRLVARPEDFDAVTARVGERIEVVWYPIDDSWLRDTGPIIVRDERGERRAMHFGFNAWGKKFEYDRDAEVGGWLAKRLELPVERPPMVLEGGSIATDGTGLFVTTERCLLNPNRNPRLSREEIEEMLGRYLGATRIVWLADAIAEDDGTDGHVDNVVAFFAPGRALLQRCADPANPNHAIARDNAARLRAAGVDLVEIPDLPYADVSGAVVPVPYVNLYPVNGAVLVPTAGATSDEEALRIIGECYPGRDVRAVPGAVLAYGGGGVHCITQQVPA